MIALISAISKNFVIGNKGRLPWSLPHDLEYFKKVTKNSVIIVGRNTFETLPILKGRILLVVTSKQIKTTMPNVYFFNSVDTALEFGLKQNRDVFFAGGTNIYKESFKYIDTMYLTEFDLDILGDTYFPTFDFDRWRLAKSKKNKFRFAGFELNYSFNVYKKAS